LPVLLKSPFHGSSASTNISEFNKTKRSQTMDNILSTVIIPTEEYTELIRTAERVETLRRYLEANKFITDADLRTILAISESKEETENETV
jgi:hypothetical protein